MTTVAPIDAAPPRKKLGWLPLLTVLFMVSYALMTMLIVEQGATIESQRALIRELFRDSTELSSSKMKALQEKNLARAPRSQAPSAKTQSPATQNPSTQAQANQAPSSQVPARRGQPRMASPYQVPSRPAAVLADDSRALITI